MKPIPLDPLEVATGGVTGLDPSTPRLPRGVRGSPRECLERAVLRVIERQPVAVSFSGGRDSSAILGIATHVARKHGLPDPVPITLHYPDVPETDESGWQEIVIRHLAIKEWERTEIHEELDLLGPVARDLLHRHGLLWPANVHTHVPLAKKVPGGTLLTGLDGDGLFQGWQWRHIGDVMARRAPASPRDVLLALYANGPRFVRHSRTKRRDWKPSPWLTPEATREYKRRWARDQADEPGRWAARLDWWSRRRFKAVICRSLDVIGQDHSVAMQHPLLDPHFLAALGQTRRLVAPGNRTQMMRMLFGDLLPEKLITRSTKAAFGDAFWGDTTREFTGAWSGNGIDPSLVDPEELSRTWKRSPPDTRTGTLLQSIWLATSGDRVQ